MVYCMEEIDNGENLSSIMVNVNQNIEETLYQNRKIELEDIKLTLVPYCYWGNRKNGEMLVWMKELFQVE